MSFIKRLIRIGGMAARPHQQTRIIGQEGTTAAALFRRPANELVSILDVERRRTPSGEGQPAALVNKGIPQVLTHHAYAV